MFSLIPLLIALSTTLIFSQYATPWLNPATYMPQAMDSIATDAMKAEYDDRCHGRKTYTVRQTKNGSDPIIDGILEDSIWRFADTLLINAWQDAGTQALGENPRFHGPQDLHAIWRFCYNQNALYVSCETYDDLWDVDSLNSWYAQDGVELAIDPGDWGYYQGSTNPTGGWPKDDFRRYWSNNGTPIPYPGDAQNCFIHLYKRANTEQYLTGLIRGTLLTNQDQGDEGTNFTLGNDNLYGIEFAAQKRGTDYWGRTVFQYEFKFPFSTDLWKELKGTYNQNGMPSGGTIFKMNFSNNDDDFPGPDGDIGNSSSLTRSRNFKTQDDPFVQYSAHWSDTRYMMTFRYGGEAIENTPPWPFNNTGMEKTAAATDIKIIAIDNYPNPFNPATAIRFSVPSQQVNEHYTLNIYDINGQLVRILESGLVGDRGLIRKVVWDGTNNLGKTVSAGIYYYRLNVGAKIKKGSMVFVK